jgi:hypothetical protein
MIQSVDRFRCQWLNKTLHDNYQCDHFCQTLRLAHALSYAPICGKRAQKSELKT